jgi:molybdopterin-guanine dinucleotide biosynthesis protein A
MLIGKTFMKILSSVILLGGKGQRLGGVPKALILRPDGQTILEHLLSVLNELQEKIQENQSIRFDPCLCLSIQADCHPKLTDHYIQIIESFKKSHHFPTAYHLIEDPIHISSPSTLDLIVHLLSIKRNHLLILACDYPFLDLSLLDLLIGNLKQIDCDHAREDQREDQRENLKNGAKVLYFQGHPLVSLWSPSALASLEKEQVTMKQRKLQTILDDLPSIRLKIKDTGSILATAGNDQINGSNDLVSSKLLNLNDPKDLALSGCHLPEKSFF